MLTYVNDEELLRSTIARNNVKLLRIRNTDVSTNQNPTWSDDDMSLANSLCEPVHDGTPHSTTLVRDSAAAVETTTLTKVPYFLC